MAGIPASTAAKIRSECRPPVDIKYDENDESGWVITEFGEYFTLCRFEKDFKGIGRVFSTTGEVYSSMREAQLLLKNLTKIEEKRDKEIKDLMEATPVVPVSVKQNNKEKKQFKAMSFERWFIMRVCLFGLPMIATLCAILPSHIGVPMARVVLFSIITLIITLCGGAICERR